MNYRVRLASTYAMRRSASYFLEDSSMIRSFLAISFFVLLPAPAIAVETEKLTCRFETTYDDKDKQDEVSIEVYEKGNIVSNPNGFGKGEVWRDHTPQGPFEIKLTRKVESQHLKIRIIKRNSTDGWQFRFMVHAFNSGGCECLVLDERSNQRFQDAVQRTGTSPSSLG
jgi:hypothetical protein